MSTNNQFWKLNGLCSIDQHAILAEYDGDTKQIHDVYSYQVEQVKNVKSYETRKRAAIAPIDNLDGTFLTLKSMNESIIFDKILIHNAKSKWRTSSL